MAVVMSFEKSEVPARLNPTETTATYRVGEYKGATILQIRTVGSDQREFRGKGSQTLQLTTASAYELFGILKKEFGFKE
jgi:hypothetical protein